MLTILLQLTIHGWAVEVEVEVVVDQIGEDLLLEDEVKLNRTRKIFYVELIDHA